MVSLLDNEVARVEFDAASKTVCMTLRSGNGPREAFDDLKSVFIRMYEGLYQRRTERVTLRFDVSGCWGANPGYIKEWTELFKRSTRITDAVVERSIIVVANPVTRAAVGAFLAIYPTRRPVEIVAP
nr:hypothetical protein TetV2_00067 [Oceanusvirus sp.]